MTIPAVAATPFPPFMLNRIGQIWPINTASPHQADIVQAYQSVSGPVAAGNKLETISPSLVAINPLVTSTKSSGSSGNIELFVAKDEDNGDGTFDRYTDSKSWNSSLTFADFDNYNLSPVGNYYVQFESTRYSTGTVAAATLKNIYVTVYYH